MGDNKKYRSMKTHNFIKSQNGVALVEFGLILPLLILLLFGIIEFALLMFNQQVITNASREGARAGVIVKIPRITDLQIKTVVKDYARNNLVTFGDDTLENGNIDILPIDTSAPFDPNTERCITFGCDLKVVVNYKYDFLVLSNLGFGPIDLRAESIMRME